MKYLILISISFLTILIVWINIRLFPDNRNLSDRKSDLILQLNFLESELKSNNLGERMQKDYPEGYIFINALYGLARCELALSDTNDRAIKEKSIDEALFAYRNINSNKAKSTFSSSLKPEYGIFYSGWRNFLLSKILSTDTTFSEYRFYKENYEIQCAEIDSAILMSGTPYLESYPGNCWPADMFVAMASLSIHDKIFSPEYENSIEGWIYKIKDRADTITKMLPHKVDAKSGRSIEGARGSSMGLMLAMLAEIKPDYAKEQYDLYKKNFVSSKFGLPFIREYPIGQDGDGDIDSGPVIFGIGFSGTIVSISTFAMLNDIGFSENQYRTINAFGFPYINGNQKKYLFGKYPMGDAFIAWGRVVELRKLNSKVGIKSGTLMEFHMISSGIVILLWIIFFAKIYRNKKRLL